MRGPSLDLKPKILQRIRDSPGPKSSGSSWTPADFADLGSRGAVDTALSRLVASGDLRRVGRGLYDKPWTNTLTARPSAPDVEAAIDAIARRQGLRYLVDGMSAANALGLTDAVPAKTIVHVDARLKAVKLGNLEIRFKPTAGSKLAWAGRPAMRLVQALHWLKDTLPRDREWLLPKIRRVLENPKAGATIREDLKSGFGQMPAWMQELLREMVFQEKPVGPNPTGPARDDAS